jgi:proline dehydrogenase
VRRAVSRFMPGESMDEALAAARTLESNGFGVILTHLGENVTRRDEAAAETAHYLELARKVREAGLSAAISVKLTQLGLDLDHGAALDNTRRIAAATAEHRLRLWIDMEDSRYPAATLDVWRALRADGRDVGVAIQSYLRRTPADIEALIPHGAVVRMVKGAYSEPPDVALPDKAEVDEAFYRMS